MRYKLLLLTTLLVVIFLPSCNRKAVSLNYTNAKNEVPQLGNLTFRFNKPLVKDSLLNTWDSTEYITFKPKIPGRFRWQSPDELIFSPSRPLPPATSFKATLNNDILENSEYNRLTDADKIDFRTPDLKLENTNTLWVLLDENSKVAVPQIDLYFNYPVNPADLIDKLDIQVDGKKAEYNIITASAAEKVSIRLTNVKAVDKDYNVSINIPKGLVPEGGSNQTKEQEEVAAFIPSPFTLNINDLSSEHDGNAGTIVVRTSQQLGNVNLASFIKLAPAVKFSTEITDEGFIITSENFDVTKSYEITLSTGLRGKIGGVLKEEYKNNLAFGSLEPSITFTNSKAVYLSSKGAGNIEVKMTNVPKVKVVISKIYESNLIAATRYGYYPKESNQNSHYASYEEEGGGDASFGDVIYEKEVETRTLPKYGNNRLFRFNVDDNLRDFKGIYHILIRSGEDYWVRDSRFISLSDIGLIAKEGKDKIVVFTNSISTASAVGGVNLVAYGYNNQVIGLASTNTDGIAEINYSRKDFDGFRPAMIIAKTADDFNYLPFKDTRVETSRFEVGGRRGNTTGLDAFVYAERDIYRPGERINFALVLRNQKWTAPGELPVKFKFIMPNGKELRSFRKNLNEQGSVDGSVDISEAAITGTYSLEVYAANDILLTTKSFMVEEFVPDRIKVTAKLNKPFLLPGEETVLNINAVNFFGPPASNRNYESEIQIKQKSFHPAKYNKYHFDLANQSTFSDKIVNQGKTDERERESVVE
jgi:uncharacterized protein YfaS (alpha-2-macroglobulin family)